MDTLRVRLAVAILLFTGGAMIYSAVNPHFHVPDSLWGIATGASLFFFTTQRDKDDKE